MTFTITANPTVRRAKIIITDGQHVIHDAALNLTSTDTVPFTTAFSQRGYRDLVLEGYDAKGNLLTAVSRRLHVR